MTGNDSRSRSAGKVINPTGKTVARLAATGWVMAMLLLPVGVTAEEGASEGVVRFFVDAKSSFDPWTRRPDKKQQAWMREHYFRMQTYSRYFDKRLSWYPQAWVYKDAYAIKPGWPIVDEHPEWVLRDADGALLYLDYGCSKGACPQYAADIGNPAFRAWWIAEAGAKIELGYAGIWVDDVNLAWRISDGHGKSVRPIDPRTGREMALHDWRRYFANFMGELREALPEVELAHNVIWYAGPTHDPFIRRQIDAADYINLERGISDRGIRGGAGKYGFETFLALIDFVHSRGKNVIMDDDDDDAIAARDYELAFYFLINNGGDLLSADGDRERMNPDNFWAGYETDLGAAAGPRYRWNGLFRRDFDCGVVLVNQPDSPTTRVALGGLYTNLDGQLVTSLSLPEASGQVLKKPGRGPCGSRPVTSTGPAE